MNLFRKSAYIIMAIFLLVPATAFANDRPDMQGGEELSESFEPLTTPKIKESVQTRESKVRASTSYITDPKSYRYIKKGGSIASLRDSNDTGHYLMFDSVSSLSSKNMNVRILYASDEAIKKDSIVNLEFYKKSKGKLSISGYTEFDTYNYDKLALNSSVPKSKFKDQRFLYIRLGISGDSSDSYYSNFTTFKVANPFYAIPTVSTVSDRDKKVKGKAEPGFKVTVKAGNKTLGKATADKAGKFTVTLKSAQKAGTVLYVTATDKNKYVSKPRKMTVIDKTPPPAPKVNKVTVKSTSVTGKAEAKATVYVKVGKKVIGSSKASSKGAFSVKIKKQKAGTVLHVYAKDKAKNTGKVTKRRCLSLPE